jgi:recombination protein RecT
MPDGNQLPARVTRAELANMRFDQALDYYGPQIAEALPEHIPMRRFKRVLITAINQDPKLAQADRMSLFNACVKCAQDGLYPDGREAVLTVYEASKKVIGEDGIERWHKIPMVQYLPMIAGIRKRMRNTGEVMSAIAEVVYRNDRFRHIKGEDARIEHEPAGLVDDPGEMVGAYAIIRLKNGEVIRESMSRSQIIAIRDRFSRGAEKDKSPWQTSESEMWRKTVLRRASKQAPTGSELDALFARDDEEPDAPAADELPRVPPRPRRAAPIIDHEDEPGAPSEPQLDPKPESDPEPEPETPKPFSVVDSEGVVHDFVMAEEAAELLISLAAGVAPRGAKAFNALEEDNGSLIDSVDGLGDRLREAWEAHRTRRSRRATADAAPPQDAAAEPSTTQAPAPVEETANADGLPAHTVEQPKAAGPASPSAEPPKSMKVLPVPPAGCAPADIRAWAWGRFLPAARKITDVADFAFLCGDNEVDLERYYRTYTLEADRFRSEIAKLNKAISG